MLERHSDPGAAPHMLLRGHLTILFGACAITGCAASPPERPGAPLATGPVETSVATEAEGVKLALPKGAKGPLYDSDDYNRARPTWKGPGWHALPTRIRNAELHLRRHPAGK